MFQLIFNIPIEGAKCIGGDRKLSTEEMRRYDNAERAFQNAVDKRYHELTGQYGTWREVN